ncbi:hypothetical protein TNCV_918831 [Trichonephila clavipes]|nr:hypothetical protein TNCV_918831 [Trichonephila clavipes]
MEVNKEEIRYILQFFFEKGENDRTLNSDIYCQQMDRLKVVTDRTMARIGQQKGCCVPSGQRHATHVCSDSPETLGAWLENFNSSTIYFEPGTK